ncbi:MAG: DNA/RNA nuclease SfsA, partial [Gammaproteobacteria bacterium]
MKFLQELQQGRLLKRYKRFLADVELADGSTLTIHCPNTGSMKNCQEPGSRIWFTDSGNAARKYPHTWQLIEVNGEHLVGINTALANKLVEEALHKGLPGELAGFSEIKCEVPYGEQRSRIDILLTYPGGQQCYIEIKNVSLAESGDRG